MYSTTGVTATCPCGTEFATSRRRLEQGRGKYCSRDCKYRYATRRSGLTYNLIKENPARFKPGREAWNKGLVKDELSYQELHRWVNRNKSKTGTCSDCNAEGDTFWANISREYHRDLDDFRELCRTCHRRFDSGEYWGKATAKFGRAAVQGEGRS